jgi:membrane associated rhomboid family serine protease
VCALVFLQQHSVPDITERLAMIPARVIDPDGTIQVVDLEPVRTRYGVVLQEDRRPALPAAVPDWLTLVTCTFLHGGWLHLIGNMWFLWIFGDNVEDRLGHLGYVGFYLGCGVAASATHLAFASGSTVPTVGASGAIAGVMGAYFLLYPRAQVLTLVPLFVFIEILVLPAAIFLGIWFVLQLVQGTFAIGDLEAGGVAWWAHVGGFVVGLVVIAVLRKRGLRPENHVRRPNTVHPGHYRFHLRRRI